MNLAFLIQRLEALEARIEILEKRKGAVEKFIAPTLFEIESECGNKLLAENFFNYYEANGWHVGKVKMKNWRAALRKWITPKTNENERIGRIQQHELQTFLNRP
jgi:hypothetical protein